MKPTWPIAILRPAFRLCALLLPVLLAFSACESRPRTYPVPDAAPLLAKQREARGHVAKGRAEFAAAAVKLRSAEASHAAARATAGRAAEGTAEAARTITLVIPALDALTLRMPPELKADAEALSAGMAKLKGEIGAVSASQAALYAQMEGTGSLLADTRTAQQNGLTEIDQGEGALREIGAKYGPEYLAQVEKLAASAGEESRGRAAAENDARHKGRIMGLALGVSAVLASLRFVKLAVPWTFAIPAGLGAAGWLAGRFFL